MLCDGEWLFELDHDDWLISTCLEDVLNASKKYPDAGFIYTDVTEVEKDNSPRQYGYIGDDWYGHPENGFVFIRRTYLETNRWSKMVSSSLS